MVEAYSILQIKKQTNVRMAKKGIGVHVYLISYQRHGIGSIKAADGILHLLTGNSTQKIADGASMVAKHINIHPRLRTR